MNAVPSSYADACDEKQPVPDLDSVRGDSGFLRGFLLMVLLGVVAATLVGSLTGPDDNGPTLGPRAIPVEVKVVQPVSFFEVERTYTGTVAARRSSQLGFERSAIILGVNVDEGDQVTAGQSLAQLDRRQLMVQFERVKAQCDEANAMLDELRAGPRGETIAAARAVVEDLRAQVELQKRQFRRNSELVKEYATPRERLDESELGLRSAEARLLAEQKQLEELEAGTRFERIAAQLAVVTQFDQHLADLKIEIDDSELVAPFDGRIAKRYVDEGTVVAPAQPVLELVESGHLEARIGIPAAVFSELNCDRPIDVVVDGKAWPAQFARVAPNLDPMTRTRLAIFDLDPSATDRIVPGQIARVAITQRLPTNGFWLPTSSLVRSVRGLWAAYVIEVDAQGASIVRRQDVEVLQSDGQRTLVRGTLQGGDRVIAEGTHRVITAGTHRVVPGQVVSIQ
ncbi:MAG: efflux RND transporter periplasmic adaptor subunit [Rubripirellula sp.]|nr:efflux RND transporter periplasmic adaptor subunit [Rubripirellula sp.]